MSDRPKLIMAEKFCQALLDTGIIRLEDSARRVVIDAEVGEPIRLYVERWGDDRLLSVVQTLEGVEISGVPAQRTP